MIKKVNLKVYHKGELVRDIRPNLKNSIIFDAKTELGIKQIVEQFFHGNEVNEDKEYRIISAKFKND